jgi:hypothetical protein
VSPSEALKKLKKEYKEEWVFKVFKNPPGLTIEHMGDTHQLSEKEMRDLMRGYLRGEYYMEVIKDKEGHEIHVLTMIDLSRYKWLPKYLYRRFLMYVCDALGLVYRPLMLEAVVSVPLTPKAVVEFAPKPYFYEYEKRAAELGERRKVTMSEIDELMKFSELLKKEGKK